MVTALFTPEARTAIQGKLAYIRAGDKKADIDPRGVAIEDQCLAAREVIDEQDLNEGTALKVILWGVERAGIPLVGDKLDFEAMYNLPRGAKVHAAVKELAERRMAKEAAVDARTPSI